jgi:hypothetical protein
MNNNINLCCSADILANKLNNLYADFCDYCTDFRERKISFHDACYFRLSYSQQSKTKQNIAAKINMKKEMNIHKSNYYRKEEKIPVEEYEKITKKIHKLYEELCIKDTTKLRLIAVDGSSNNTNINTKKHECQTSLNMGFFDADNGIPIDFTYVGSNKQNSEIEQLTNAILSGKLDGTIITADRAYCKLDLFVLLNNRKIYFVIRIRNNLTILNKEKHSSATKKFLFECPEARIVTSKKYVDKTVRTNSDKARKIRVPLNYNLITNLPLSYTEDDVMNIYCKRWTIEEYFKFVKHNTNFEHSKEKKKESLHKNLHGIQQVSILRKLLVDALNLKENYSTTIQKRNGKKVQCQKKINETLLIEGIYEHLLEKIIYGTLAGEYFKTFLESYIVQVKNENDRHNPRISKTPFTKWYVKSYHEIYLWTKIITAVINNDLSGLNKNQKVIAKNIQIIK